MKSVSTVETKRLAEADALISRILENYDVDRTELRMQILEAVASHFGGFDLRGFHSLFRISTLIPIDTLLDSTQVVVRAVEKTNIPPSLCLSALSRETLDVSSRRFTGAYHTDFRLALHLARTVEGHLTPITKVLDPACGAGILLTAVSHIALKSGRIVTNEWLRNCVYATDLSPQSLRGTLLSLAALTDDLKSLQTMRSKWRIQDSLLTTNEKWRLLAPNGFDVVVANPPWEKLKLSRHEFIKSLGKPRKYGASYVDGALKGYERAKLNKTRLAARLADRYSSLSKGEPDLYIAFTELLLRLTREGGSGAILLPAGLIRSLNTGILRENLFNSSCALSITIMENRARYFAIDTRFKFLFVNYVKGPQSKKGTNKITIRHATADDDAIVNCSRVTIPIDTLKNLRPNLTLPEVRTSSEWELFKKMQSRAVSIDTPNTPWFPSFCREIDMTRDRSHFVNSPVSGFLPLVEGRMVQPHRIGCKSYLYGEGRSARWQSLPSGQSIIKPQFWVSADAIPIQTRGRVDILRAGFCDITGQTNERTMMATIIPPGVVCGNKVPTIQFHDDHSEDRLFLWLAIVNSLPFDWLLRRTVTTTVNYFVLLSIRLPDIEIDSSLGQRLVEISRELADIDSCGNSSLEFYWRLAEMRAEADALVASAYGCDDKDIRLMLLDFPLLDRGQPHLANESKSTVTSDLFLATWIQNKWSVSSEAQVRFRKAKAQGAIAYLSSEFFEATRNFNRTSHE